MDNSSLQSLRTALIAGVRRPDVLADLLDDGEQLAVLAGVEASPSSGMLGGEVRSPNKQLSLGSCLAVETVVQVLKSQY